MLNNLSPIVHFCGLKRLCGERRRRGRGVRFSGLVTYRGNGPFCKSRVILPQATHAHHLVSRRHTAHHDRAGPASRVYGPLPASAISVSLSARPAPSPPPSRLSVSQRESLPDFLTRRRPPARSPMQHSSCRWRPCPSTESHNTTARRAPPTESAPPQAFSLSLPPPHIPCRGSSPHTDCAHARPCWPALPDRRASRPSRTGLKAPPPRPRRR